MYVYIYILLHFWGPVDPIPMREGFESFLPLWLFGGKNRVKRTSKPNSSGLEIQVGEHIISSSGFFSPYLYGS